MRDHLRRIIFNARRSGDRIDVDGAPTTDAPLGTDLVRLARLATSMHLGSAARHLAVADPLEDRATATRESSA